MRQKIVYTIILMRVVTQWQHYPYLFFFFFKLFIFRLSIKKLSTPIPFEWIPWSCESGEV